jgi:hypothetical protein
LHRTGSAPPSAASIASSTSFAFQSVEQPCHRAASMNSCHGTGRLGWLRKPADHHAAQQRARKPRLSMRRFTPRIASSRTLSPAVPAASHRRGW